MTKYKFEWVEEVWKGQIVEADNLDEAKQKFWNDQTATPDTEILTAGEMTITEVEGN
jgi:hypothetical protein